MIFLGARCILRSRSRPLGDLGRGVVLLLFQIGMDNSTSLLALDSFLHLSSGSIVTFTLAAPSLPCATEGNTFLNPKPFGTPF